MICGNLSRHTMLRKIHLNKNIIHDKIKLVNMKASSSNESDCRIEKPILFDFPHSNHGARVKYLIYSKSLESEIEIKNPLEVFESIKEGKYIKYHPFGKVPCLVFPNGSSIPESQVIADYILDKYKNKGPSYLIEDPEKNAKCRWLLRLHDNYYSPIQAALYRLMEIEDRANKIKEMGMIINLLEEYIEGPYFLGNEMSMADICWMPSFCYLTNLLPNYFGWTDFFKGRPKLKIWWHHVQNDEIYQKFMKEAKSVFEKWEESGRFSKVKIKEHAENKNFQWIY